MDDLNTALVEGVISLIGAVVVYLGIQARKWISKVENDYVQGVLSRLTDAIETSVRDAAQTIVPVIKDAAADGKLSEQEKANIKKQVREAALDQLTRVDRGQLKKLFDDGQLDRRIDREIEAFVQRLKS